MRQLLYVSNTSQNFGAADLENILAVSRVNTAARGITGMLVYIDGGFLQVLEGEEGAVRSIYARIAADHRHWEARLLLDHEAPRAFGAWSMGFERPRSDTSEIAGLFNVTQDAILGRLSPNAGKVIAVMLQTFYRVHHGDNLLLAG